MATPEMDPFQQVPADIQITLGPGGSFVGPPNAGGGLRNVGLDEATVLLAIVEPVTAGTPAP